jgi:hypothetical protein
MTFTTRARKIDFALAIRHLTVFIDLRQGILACLALAGFNFLPMIQNFFLRVMSKTSPARDLQRLRGGC